MHAYHQRQDAAQATYLQLQTISVGLGSAAQTAKPVGMLEQPIA
jgi:hypothetical protein